MELAIVIMAGGVGTRLYPASTRERPKQFIPWPPFDSAEALAAAEGLGNGNGLVDGANGVERRASLIQRAYARLAPLAGTDRVFIAATSELLSEIEQNLPHTPKQNIILEPMRRNSAGACAFATAYVADRVGLETVVVIVPADAVVLDEEVYQATVKQAAALAHEHRGSVVVGVRPDRPATEYGYVSLGDPVGDGAHRVGRFIEKPTLERALVLLSEGCLWNAGIFVWRGDTARTAFQQFLPVHGRLFDGDLSHSRVRAIFQEMPVVSVDVGIAERADNVYCVPGEFRWDDLGAWDAFSRVLPADESGNVHVGKARFVQSENCVTVADGGEVIALGVSDLVIVRFGDVVLVCPRSRAQDVGKLAP